MQLHKAVCVTSVLLVLLSVAVTDARSRHRHQSRNQEEEEPAVIQVQVQEEEPKPVETEPVQSEEVSSGSKRSRPARQRKAPVLCNANAAAANQDEPDKQETPASRFVIIQPESAESPEIASKEEKSIEAPAAKPKPVKKPKGKVVEASSEESQSESSEEDDEEEESDEDDSNGNFSAALESLEQPEAPKALTNDEIPEENTRAVESEEEKPKARRSKHHRSDVRRIERPHRRRVVFRDSDEDDD